MVFLSETADRFWKRISFRYFLNRTQPVSKDRQKAFGGETKQQIKDQSQRPDDHNTCHDFIRVQKRLARIIIAPMPVVEATISAIINRSTLPLASGALKRRYQVNSRNGNSVYNCLLLHPACRRFQQSVHFFCVIHHHGDKKEHHPNEK